MDRDIYLSSSPSRGHQSANQSSNKMEFINVSASYSKQKKNTVTFEEKKDMKTKQQQNTIRNVQNEIRQIYQAKPKDHSAENLFTF